MDLTALPDPLRRVLRRLDIRPLAEGVRIRFDAALRQPWHIDAEGGLVFGAQVLTADHVAVALRHALELRLLQRLCPDRPVLAGLAAARTTALFLYLEQIGDGYSADGGFDGRAPDWASSFDGAPPALSDAAAAWRQLRIHQPDAPATIAAADHAALTRIWPLLGPAEYLMQTGGDQRLRLDPVTGLNFYGCSHRPRPWAVTYASSTASSSSERGYGGAEACRVRLLATALARDGVAQTGLGQHLADEAQAVRRAIAGWYGLAESDDVVLAASGTDCELFALALAQLHPAGRPVTNILVAPEETGSGVPFAATGRHFAADTAYGVAVEPHALVEGYDPATTLVTIDARCPDGSVACPDAVAEACTAAVERAVAAGGRAVLHLLDLSKTGLLSPSPEAVAAIAARFGDDVDVVVDACQARLSAARVRDYLGRGWTVLITGSKFFTGPPFCGALLLPSAMLARLDRAALPIGLAAYSARADWPNRAAAGVLRDEVNLGLLLRWRAALAEMEAFAKVPPATRYEILSAFTTRVLAGIAANPDLDGVEVPPLARPEPATGDAWDMLGTILSFAVRDPQTGARMDVPVARALYRWLNADLTGALPAGLNAAEIDLCRRHMHIGQPAPLIGPDGARFGALRISAGARLFSGEPSHARLTTAERVEREIADALAVLDKISLILRHLPLLRATDPQATFL